MVITETSQSQLLCPVTTGNVRAILGTQQWGGLSGDDPGEENSGPGVEFSKGPVTSKLVAQGVSHIGHSRVGSGMWLCEGSSAGDLGWQGTAHRSAPSEELYFGTF